MRPAKYGFVVLLMVALVFAGAGGTAPGGLQPAHAQRLSVVGTILGLVIIAGIIYLVTQDQQGAFHRYPFGQYNPTGPHYRYQGPYAIRYRAYQNRFYNGPVPGQWNGEIGRMNWFDLHAAYQAHCLPQQDNYGRWGRDRVWDGWCAANLRFRLSQPDDLWRQYNPFDTGSANDHVGGGH
jgi:hypothetical protein